jgi:RNA polymerase sigma factor (sigma-70 family)
MATVQLDTLIRHIKEVAAGPAGRDRSDRQLLDDFTSGGDEAAFAGLVERHGPLVLRVCRRVLRHEQDAEDAFQATFLVLAKHPTSIRRREALASWLYGVAYRTAMKAKRSVVRRRNHEARLRHRQPPAAASPTWDDVQEVLHEEIERLPELFRSAFVLCVLDGKTVAAAAAAVGVKEGTLSWRLAKARQRLRQQLTRRGIELSAVLAALSLAVGASEAAVPAVLASGAVRLGLLVAAGSPAAVIPAPIAALAAGVTRAMFLTRMKIAALVLVTAVLLAGVGALMHHAPAAGPEAGGLAEGPVPVRPALPEKGERIAVDGRVLGPNNLPVAGAKLFLCDLTGKHVAPQPAADAGGHFRFDVPIDGDPFPLFLVATADGLGLDWSILRAHQSARDLTLHLPADVPIRGKVVNLEGKPVAGVTVRTVEVTTSKSGTLDEFLKQWAADKEKKATGDAFHLMRQKQLWPARAVEQLGTVTTGADGTFRLTGIGRDRGVLLGVRGPGIADHYVRIVTRPDYVVQRLGGRDQVALLGPEPTVAVAPDRPILGTVRDARTKVAVPGVRVLAYLPDQPLDLRWQVIEIVTDAKGGYRLDGVGKARQVILAFDPGPGAVHMHRFAEISDIEGLRPVVHDTELHRGVVVHGCVTDKSTGRPVRARVVYCPLFNNPHFDSTPGYDRPRVPTVLWVDSREMTTGADGRYRLTALPGPGALFVQAEDRARGYTQPVVSKEDKGKDIYDERAEVFLTRGLGDIFPMPNLHAYRLVRPAVGATDLTADFTLVPGVERRGRLVDPDGRELKGAEAMNLSQRGDGTVRLPGAEFTVEALNPARQRRLLFWHHGRKLAGTIVLRGDEPEPVTVTLRPLATLTGRALRKNGEPLIGFSVEPSGWPEVEWPSHRERGERQQVLTDKEGRFRIPDLPAGMPLSIHVTKSGTGYSAIYREKIVLEPGKTKDLGELRGDPLDE